MLSDMNFDGLGHKDTVNDISWSSLNGRSFHYVVSCGVEGVFVWRFKFDASFQIQLLDRIVFGASSQSVPVCVSWNLMVVGRDGRQP